MAFALAVGLLFFVGCKGRELASKYDLDRNALGRIESRDALIRALDDPAPGIRADAVRYLARFRDGAADVLPKLKALAQTDDDLDVRRVALNAIATVHPNRFEAIEYLSAYAEAAPSESLGEAAESAIASVRRSRPPRRTIAIARADGSPFASVTISPDFSFGSEGHRVQAVAGFGVLPVGIVLQNLSSSPIELNPGAASLQSPVAGRVAVSAMSADEASSSLARSMGSAVARAIMLGPFGWASPGRTASANRQMTAQAHASIFDGAAIDPAMEKSGYLFFPVSRRERYFIEYELRFSVRDVVSGDVYGLEYRLGGAYELTRSQGPGPRPTGTSPSIPDLETKLRGLKSLFEEGLITEAEYSDKRKALLEAY